jgi:S1-C subfamily serine protease
LGQLRDKRAADILTNCHVITDAREIRVTDKQGNRSAAAILYFDASSDVALLRASLKSVTTEPEIANDISEGDNVYAVGTPKGLGWTISNGIVSGIRKRDTLDVVQTTAPISPGSSGGGLFNDAC